MSLRAEANRIVNALGIVAMLAVIASGVVLLTGRWSGLQEATPGLLGLRGYAWLEIHESGVAALIAVVVVHLALHWRQLVSLCKQCIRRPKRLAGDPVVILAMVILALLTAGAMPDEGRAERGDDCESGGLVWGSIGAYFHAAAAAAAAAGMAVHVLRRWRRILRAT